MARCFIGFLLPEDVKNEVVLVQKEINAFPMVCKLVERENLHICFSFLGDIENLDETKEKLDMIAQEFSKTEVLIGGLKAIPNEKYIRVMVLDVRDQNDILNKIQKRINQEIGGDNKPPHITLCRVKNITNKNLVAEKIKEMRNKSGSRFIINSVQLIESKLSRSGPIYTVIHESKLS